ncbi:hypothetical protein ACN47E_001665 [Coniothyrium glycines]
MSEEGSTPPRRSRSSRSGRNQPRHFPADFPIRNAVLSNEINNLTASLQELVTAFGQVSTEIQQLQNLPAQYTQRARRSTGLIVPQVIAMSPGTMQTARNEPKPQRPVIAVTSALPKTPYKEEDGAERSRAYVQVQGALLKWLTKNPSDTLTARQARSWTENIDMTTKRPKAKEALALCYYMRSQGIDTYGLLKFGQISLYLVSPATNALPQRASMYWQQSVKTDVVTFRAVRSDFMFASPFAGAAGISAGSGPTVGRIRAPIPLGMNTLLAQLQTSTRNIPLTNPGATAPRQNLRSPPSVPRNPTMDTLQAEAEEHLNRLLTQGPLADSVAVEAAVAQIQELHSIDRE